MNASSAYFPERGHDWERRSPEEAGFDPGQLADAVAYAESHETPASREFTRHVDTINDQPYPEMIGPLKDRDAPNGLIVRHGTIVAEWGDTRRVDMTFSVAKSYLSTVAGLAFDRGLIRNPEDPVCDYVDLDAFSSPKNARITWQHLLQQTSEWDGELWDKPYWSHTSEENPEVTAGEPGSAFAYNDVRVNLLSLSLLNLWRRPLPQVLKEYVMDPIGASATWRWHGYENSWVTLDGLRMQSVSGGGHWGGGLWASTRDHARFGLLFLNGGRWGDKQLISEEWIKRSTTPCPIKPDYGYLWWLDTDQEGDTNRPKQAFSAVGFNGNRIWIEPNHGIVVVLRWTDPEHHDEVKRRVLSALQ